MVPKHTFFLAFYFKESFHYYLYIHIMNLILNNPEMTHQNIKVGGGGGVGVKMRALTVLPVYRIV